LKCSSLSSISIPDCVEIICSYCFSSCTSLNAVTFEPNSRLSRIETWAFSHCLLTSAIGSRRSRRSLRESRKASKQKCTWVLPIKTS
jgi:hypothetical protein